MKRSLTPSDPRSWARFKPITMRPSQSTGAHKRAEEHSHPEHIPDENLHNMPVLDSTSFHYGGILTFTF